MSRISTMFSISGFATLPVTRSTMFSIGFDNSTSAVFVIVFTASSFEF